MANQQNVILGFGERLTSAIDSPRSSMKKEDPYSFEVSIERLEPLLQSTIATLISLPAEACPGDEAVVAMTLHPEYVARSYYPEDLLSSFGLRAVGTKQTAVYPTSTTRKRSAGTQSTTDLYIAGLRSGFQRLAQSIKKIDARSSVARDIVKIENIRFIQPRDRIKPIDIDFPFVNIEVVLHADERPETKYVIEGFDSYLRSVLVDALVENHLFVRGLCFIPLRVDPDSIESIASYSFVRLARQMPQLRPLQFSFEPNTLPHFPLLLPTAPAVDPSLRVAVFDGGVPENSSLSPWVTSYEAPGLGNSRLAETRHGVAVSSALLFGPLAQEHISAVPFAAIDHYRVLDDQVTNAHDPAQMYKIIQRIKNVLAFNNYEFVNISLGPNQVIEDDDVDPWTSTLDELFASGKTLATIAVGNDGACDRALGLGRIQPPSDCVNALAIGSCNSRGTRWDRAGYSSYGPGRSPGRVKPDAMAFGGDVGEPFYVVDAVYNVARGELGTSFASPYALRLAVGARAHLGAVLTPIALKALLIHGCKAGDDRLETGWGRLPNHVRDMVFSNDHTAHILYRGEFTPASWTRFRVPMPLGETTGLVTIKATVCTTCQVDPNDAANYTRGGLEIVFRPNKDKQTEDKQYAETLSFFQASDHGLHGPGMRSDAHRWETVRTKSKQFKSKTLNEPVFDIHYIAREEGHTARTPFNMPYAVVITVSAPGVPDLYNQIATRYQTVLQPLQPVIQIPVTV